MPYTRARARIAALATCAAMLLCLSAAAAPAGAAVPGVVPDLTWGLSSADQQREGVALKDLGARWVRLHVQWRDAEPSKGVYDAAKFAEYDNAVTVARAAGARVLFMVYEAPAWASGSSSSNVPRDPADYAAFVRYMAQRYRGQAAAYEIWNEPGHPRFWSTGRNPVAYTKLLAAAYPAIKGADPQATVVLGGLSSYDYKFLDEVYAAGGRGSFDAVALHPYTDCGISPLTTWYDSAGKLFGYAFTGYREVRKRMLALGDDKPLWFTEMGWTTTSESCNTGAWTSGVSETAQADYLTKAWDTMAKDPYVQVAFWYNLRNEAGERDHVEGRWGLLHADFSPKPSAAAFKQAVTLYGGDAASRLPRRARLRRPPRAPTPTPAPSPRRSADGRGGRAPGRGLGVRPADAGHHGHGQGRQGRDLRRAAAWTARASRPTAPLPYGTHWRLPRRWATGAHTVSAVAADAAGHRSTSTVTVYNGPAPATTLKLAVVARTAVATGKVTGRRLGPGRRTAARRRRPQADPIGPDPQHRALPGPDRGAARDLDGPRPALRRRAGALELAGRPVPPARLRLRGAARPRSGCAGCASRSRRAAPRPPRWPRATRTAPRAGPRSGTRSIRRPPDS